MYGSRFGGKAWGPKEANEILPPTLHVLGCDLAASDLSLVGIIIFETDQSQISRYSFCCLTAVPIAECVSNYSCGRDLDLRSSGSDAIRRQAHRAAADQALNYNPFARTRSRPGQSQDVPHSDNVESTPPFGVDRASTDRPASQPIVGGHVPNAASGSSQKSTYVHDVTLTQPSPSVDDSVHEIQRKRPLRRRWQAIFRRDQDDIFEEPEDLTMEERKARALKRKIPFGVQVRSILFLNTRTKMATALAPCIIAGFVLNYTHSNSIAVFCVNFVAIIPSASVLSFCLNELMIRSGEKVSALLNQTFG